MIKHRSDTQWLNDREIGWRRARFIPCTRRLWTRVFWFSLKIKVDGFSRFGLKTGGYGSCGLTSKPLARVFLFVPQNRQMRFGDLGHKITATFFWFGHQNQVAMIYRLPHKTDRMMKTAWNTHRDLATCFSCKWVGLGFLWRPILKQGLSVLTRIIKGWHYRNNDI
jgi:hypothetical protein